ncbi:hypothetical protein ACFLU5_08980 [Bacteroidota bacterium]
MKNVKWILTIIILCTIISNVNSQIERGYLLIGGGGNISNDIRYDRFSISLSPMIGWFVKDRVVVGGIFDTSFTSYYNDAAGYEVFYLYLAPGCRYYLGKSHLKFFGEAALYFGNHWRTDNVNSGNFDFTGAIGIGMVYFVTDQIGIEFLSRYGLDEFVDFNDLRLSIGIQIHLPGKKILQSKTE